jgi:serine/threonine protein kinase
VAGAILGTAAYMAPEQARGKKVDKRADIWAFGVVAWEMLTGERLFRGEDTVQLLSNVLQQPVDLERVPPKSQAAGAVFGSESEGPAAGYRRGSVSHRRLAGRGYEPHTGQPAP